MTANDHPAAESVDPGDAALIDELSELLRPRLVPPPEVVEAGKREFGWRAIDAELARLVYDSLIDAHDGARSGDEPRLLTFTSTTDEGQAGGAVIEMEVDTGAGGRRIVGQVEPAAEAELEVRAGEVGAAEEVVARGRADAMGRFVLPLPAGRLLVSVRYRFPDGTLIQTARVRL